MVALQGASGAVGVSPYQLFPAVACLLSNIDESYIKKSYEGYEVLRVNISNRIAFEAIKGLYLGENFDFWSAPSMDGPTDIMVTPEQVETLRLLLNSVNARYSVLYSNLDEMVQIERSNNEASLVRDAGAMNWEAYQNVDTIHAWMDKMAEQYPALVSVTTYGTSTEGRPLKVMKISSGETSANRSAIWLDSGIHAREWITPATSTYIANKLIHQVTRERNNRLVDGLDWYIAPSLNPDGYAFTMTNDRFWRKTRSAPDKNSTFGGLFGCCKGADPNRNWDYQWGGKGTSKHQCSQIYHGASPASEPEVSSTQNFIYGIKNDVKLFVTLHSYSQLILLPWCYDNVRTDDHEDLLRVANKAAAALESNYGTKYKVGPTAELLYPAAGGSFDWAKGVAGIKYAYAFELRDTGRFGFLLPPNQIIPTGEETFSAIKSMAEDVKKEYGADSETQQSQSGNQLYGGDRA